MAKRKNPNGALWIALDHCERTHLIAALAESNGNVSHAASLLGIEKSHMHKRMKHHQIDKNGRSTAAPHWLEAST